MFISYNITKAYVCEDSLTSLPVKSIAVGLKASLEESILCKSETKSRGIDEKASLDKYVKVFMYCTRVA